MPETVATRLRSVPSSLRTRIVAWFVGVLGLATAASIVATNVVLEIRLDQRIGSELVQEAAELRRLASGNDPRPGRRSARTSAASSPSSSTGRCRPGTKPS